MLEFRNKYKIENPKRGKSVTENKFFNWTNKNLYRTSYNDMRTTEPVMNK